MVRLYDPFRSHPCRRRRRLTPAQRDALERLRLAVAGLAEAQRSRLYDHLEVTIHAEEAADDRRRTPEGGQR